MIHQLSIFLENRPGQLLVPCPLLGDAGIDILDLSLADTERFGILRHIVEDWQRARGQSATLLARVEDPAAAAVRLAQHGVRLVAAEELLASARR